MRVSPVSEEREGVGRNDELWLYVARLAAGDRDALASLYDRTRRLVYSLALRILGRPEDAEEITIEVYTQVWRHAARYDPGRGSVEAWLITITRTRAIDRLRLRAARPDMGALATVDTVAKAEALADPIESWEARERVARMLSVLTPDERRLITLAFFEGWTHTELAGRLALPLGTVKTRIRAGLHKMRRALADGVRPTRADDPRAPRFEESNRNAVAELEPTPC